MAALDGMVNNRIWNGVEKPTGGKKKAFCELKKYGIHRIRRREFVQLNFEWGTYTLKTELK